MLAQFAGFPLNIGLDLDEVSFPLEEVNCLSTVKVALTDLLLLNRSVQHPKNVYTIYQGVKHVDDQHNWPEDLNYDLVCIPAGLLGIEYMKSHIYHASAGVISSVIQVISGEATILMQKNKPNSAFTMVEEVVMATVKAGEKAVIPADYYYVFVNTGEEPVVFARVAQRDHIADYQHLTKQNGAAYFLISKNALPQLVANPKYRIRPVVKQLSASELNRKAGYILPAHTPLYGDTKAQPTLMRQLMAA